MTSNFIQQNLHPIWSQRFPCCSLYWKKLPNLIPKYDGTFISLLSNIFSLSLLKVSISFHTTDARSLCIIMYDRACRIRYKTVRWCSDFILVNVMATIWKSSYVKVCHSNYPGSFGKGKLKLRVFLLVKQGEKKGKKRGRGDPTYFIYSHVKYVFDRTNVFFFFLLVCFS